MRHGARAPVIPDDSWRFKVPMNELTASGIRMRHMLGKFNRERYVHQYGLLDEIYNPSQIYVQGTVVPRVI